MRGKTVFLQIILLLMAGLVMVSCGGGGGKTYPRFSSDNTEIVNFTFPAAKNSVLPSDVFGVIDGDNIAAVVPHDTDVTALVAEFVTNSADVTVNDNLQRSGITTCDYSSPVQFKITSESGSVRIYTVTVTRAPSGEKSITAFVINQVSGTVNDSAGTITVELPAHSIVTGLVPSFQAPSATVKVGDVVQVSSQTVNDFTKPVVYTVVAEDNTSRTYEVKVVVLKDTAKELTTFSFLKESNTSLPGDCLAEIMGDSVSVELPFGTSTSGLVPSFTTTGDHVNVGDALQTSGDTGSRQDFGSPVDYTVVAEDGSVHTYTVNVTVAKNSAKEITSFSIDGVDGIFSEGENGAAIITLTFPQVKNLSALKAEFGTTGEQVTVNNVPQVSGESENNFSGDVEYIVTAANGSTKTYTVKATASAEVVAVWNFDDPAAEGYTVSGVTSVEGVEGTALYFDSIDYLLVPDSDALTLATAGSVEATVKVSSNQFCAGIVHKGVKKDFSDEAYSLQYWSGNVVRIMITNDAGTSIYAQSTTKMVAGTWYHFVATWDAASLKLYVNGSCEATTPNTIGSVRNTAGGLVIGAQLADEQYSTTYHNLGFNGIIDSVRILSRAMTADEITARYNSLPLASGSAISAYLISAVSRHTGAIGLILLAVFTSLGALYMVNRRRAGRAM